MVVTSLVLLTDSREGVDRVLPSLTLLRHRVRVVPLSPSVLVDLRDAEVVLVDARRELVIARAICQLAATLDTPPVLLVLDDGGWPVVEPSWAAADVVSVSAGPAELDARIRLLAEREVATAPDDDRVETGDLVIDASGYTARLRGQVLDLTYKEFELLRYLAANPGRVFTRAQLLQEVWGYDYFGGTRTVDVHVRRLRAKLGVEYDQLIGTVRNVGYRFNDPLDADDAH
ncbi:DNA-binding response regulator, OmpR family, contains REC and winged-helix (wHTH) domain [Ruaniaceae bacterium KH17]|nr:DNA-binding response regulator, OmpR family, contains REC and winged-helix (wHTH) domain [Ruaniaceae bacterium KH17]